MCHTVAEEGAVGESGQGVVEGLVLELLLELLAERDVVYERAEVDVLATPDRPDGQLRQELVAIAMQGPLTTIDADESVDEIVTALTGGVNAVVVADAGKPIGVVTRSDLLEYLAHAR